MASESDAGDRDRRPVTHGPGYSHRGGSGWPDRLTRNDSGSDSDSGPNAAQLHWQSDSVGRPGRLAARTRSNAEARNCGDHCY